MSQDKPTNWGATLLEETQKKHASEVGALRKELEQTKATLERTRAARRVKLPPPLKTRGRVAGDIVRVIIPDTHGAKVYKPALNAMLADIKAMDPHEIILLGDHVDCGGFLAQHLVMGYVAEADYSYEQDLEHANAFLDALQKAAPRAKIEYIEGNHERRVETWAITQTLRHQKDAEGLRRLYSPEFRLNLAERGIKYFRQAEFYDGLTSTGIIKRGNIFYVHGISTASCAAVETIRRIGANVVFGHTHRAESAIKRPVGKGVIGGWNPGCLCELQPLWNHTKPTDWTHGYAVELIAPSQSFLHLNIPIIDGQSLFASLFKL